MFLFSNFLIPLFFTAFNLNKETTEIPYNRAIKDLRSLSTKIGLLTRLETLHLPNNFINGALPESISSLKMLRELNLYGNEMSGTLPIGLFDLQGLKILSLGRNSFKGSIPTEIGNLHNLQALHLGYNMMLTGRIPSEIGLLEMIGML